MPRRLKVKYLYQFKLLSFVGQYFANNCLNYSELSKPKARRIPSETLKGIQEVYKRTDEEKRRLELESQLYKRWRPASREENILLSSRSNNEALAKMNWLDKQVRN